MKTKLILLLSVFVGVASALYFLTIPRQQPDSKQADVNAINFNGTILKMGDEFNFEPKDPCIADMKAKLSYLDKDSVSLSLIEEQRIDRKYYALDPADTAHIKIGDNECVQGYSLCKDLVYHYCLMLNKQTVPYSLTYEVKSKSTAPILNEKDSIPNEKEIVNLFPAYKENFLKKYGTTGIADLGYMKVVRMEGLPDGVYVIEWVYLGEGGKTLPTEGGFTLAGSVNGKTVITESGDVNYCRWIESATLSESDRAYMSQDCPK